MRPAGALLLLLPACADLAHQQDPGAAQASPAHAALPGPGPAQLGTLAGPPGSVALAPARPTAQQLEAQTRLGLQLLHAKAVEEQLSGGARLVVPDPPQTIGDTVPVRVELRNLMGLEVELYSPPEGMAIELTWSVDRWLPYGARDQHRLQRVARLTGVVQLAVGDNWYEDTELPLQLEGDAGALWEIRLQAQLHCDGARLGDRTLPVKDVSFREARFLAFPDGWQPLAADPLGQLRKVAALPNPSVDRHVLVCAALLPPQDRNDGMAALVQALQAPASPARSSTLTTALSWLTGEALGDAPAAWQAWWEARSGRTQP